MEPKLQILQELMDNDKTLSVANSLFEMTDKGEFLKTINFKVEMKEDSNIENVIYSLKQWTDILSDPRNIIIKTANNDQKEKYFTKKEVEDRVAKIATISLDSNNSEIPLTTNKDQTSSDYYKNVFIPMSNNFFKSFTLDMIKNNENNINEGINKIGVLQDNLKDFDVQFSKMDRSAGKTWRPDNPKRYDKVRESLDLCLEQCDLTYDEANKYRQMLQNIIPIIEEYSNFADVVANNLTSLNVDSAFNISGLDVSGFSTFGWISVSLSLFVGLIALTLILLASGPAGWIVLGIAGLLLIVGGFFIIIQGVSAANKLMDWYDDANEKLEDTTKDLTEMYESLHESNSSLGEIWDGFQELAGKINENDLPISNGGEIAQVFKIYVGEFNKRLAEETKLSNLMKSTSTPISDAIEKSKKIIMENNPYEGEEGDDDEIKVWEASNKNKYSSLALKWLLTEYGKSKPTDSRTPEDFEEEIRTIAINLDDEEIERLMITAVFIHAETPSEVFEKAKFDIDLILEVKNHLIDTFQIAA